MALVHTHKGQLPEARALLYEETVDILLWRWEQVKASETGEPPCLRSLLHQAGRTDVDLKRALWQLAFTAHRDGGTTDGEAVADIGEMALAQALRALHPDQSRDWAYQVIEVMQLRTGLLLERDQRVYSFPHRTFQEYLAGAYLSVQGDFARQAAALAAAGAFWREVILLAVGRLVHVSGELDKPRALLEELCPTRRQRGASAWRREGLAGEVLLEMGRSRVCDSAAGQALDARVRQRLVTLLRTPRLPAVQRVAMGDTLAGLGDPRFRDEAWFLPAEPLLGLVEIPAGPFRMGSDPGQDAEARAVEQRQHEVVLPRYYLGRYPVTVAQWRAFVQVSGHTRECAASLQGLANHPVVWVSWHEALAYCQWLTARLREWSGTPEPLASLLRQAGWEVTLPNEAEWEKAARGTDGRRYPWGEAPDPNRANYDDTRIGRTSAVGCFPGGVSFYQLEEMSGNVWEWTRSLWGPLYRKTTFPYPYNPDDGREQLHAADEMRRVLRGGAFWDDHQCARCAYRSGYGTRDVDDYVGFRVVVRPCSGLWPSVFGGVQRGCPPLVPTRRAGRGRHVVYAQCRDAHFDWLARLGKPRSLAVVDRREIDAGLRAVYGHPALSWSSAKAWCKTRTASLVYFSSMTQEILISEVLIMRILIFSAARASNMRAATPAWLCMPAPTIETLAISVCKVASFAPRSARLSRASSRACWASERDTVNEISVNPPSLAF